MKPFSLPLSALLLVLPAACQEKSDKDRLQGTWERVEGQKHVHKVVIKDSRATLYLENGMVGEARMRVESAVLPKSLDFVSLDAKEQGLTLYAIYRLDGDDWEIAFPQPASRPKQFTPENSILFRRKK